MKKVEWNEEKNEILKETRGVSFGDVETIINDGKILDVLPNPNNEKYPNQKLLVVRLNEYIHYVPFVEDSEKYFLKSIIPSRKMNTKY